MNLSISDVRRKTAVDTINRVASRTLPRSTRRAGSVVTVTDLFCGCGGSSEGAEEAGAEVRLAINHWPRAVEVHGARFAQAAHDCCDISAADPRRYPGTTILLASPECTNHSIAKGKKRKNQAQLDLLGGRRQFDPAEERSRITMFDVPRFAEYHDYQIVIVENVVDARHWRLFDAWIMAMRALDYEHESVYLNSQFVPPTPQSRDRVYFVFWKRRNRRPNLKIKPLAYCTTCEQQVESVQSWKDPRRRWGKYRQQYVYRCPRCAAEVRPDYTPALAAVDFNLPAKRIGDRSRRLAPSTLRRVQSGLDRFSGTPITFDSIRQDFVYPAVAARSMIMSYYGGSDVLHT